MNYTATQFVTAEDKAKFVEHFIKFVEKDFPQNLFTKKFYSRLSNTFGHIAHYNQFGFWEEFFTTTADKVRFIEMTLNSPCYGDPAYTFSDAEREIQYRMIGSGILAHYKAQYENELCNAEYNEYQRLKEKFESA
jgi:hypothetical protein